MGIITMQEEDFVASEQWFRKALPIAEEREMLRSLAICYRHLGILSAHKKRFIESGEWMIRAVLASTRLGDAELVEPPHICDQVARIDISARTHR